MNETYIKKQTETNRLAWNEAMPYHQQANKNHWDQAFSMPGYVSMPTREVALLNDIDITDKRIAHVCCNNGVELMSLKNMGAGECVGFDICDEAILEAQLRAKKFNIVCQFIREDIYDVSPEYHGHFDLVYISAGCLIWMPDIERFFKKLFLLLSDSGNIFIHEIHPVAHMLPLDFQADRNPLEISNSYFCDAPVTGTMGLDYVGNTQYHSREFYMYLRPFSELIMALVNNQFMLKHFTEYTYDLSHNLNRVVRSQLSIPLSYILISEKS